jgi:HlyD family secretion protein
VKNYKSLFVVAVALLALGVVLYASFPPSGNHASVPKTEKVDLGPIIQRVASATGKLTFRDVTVISTDLPVGRVVELGAGIEIGAKVGKSGRDGNPQVLLKLDDTMARLNLRKAEAELEAAKATVVEANAAHQEAEQKKRQAENAYRAAERYLKAVQASPTRTQDLLDRAEAQLETARESKSAAERAVLRVSAAIDAATKKVKANEAGVEAAQQALELLTISVPVDGTIIDLKIVKGQLISPQTNPVLCLIAPSLEHLELVAQVGESDIGQIQDGMEATFTVDAFPEEKGEDGEPLSATFRGKVRRVAETPTASSPRLPMLAEMGAGAISGPISYAVYIDGIEFPNGWTSHKRLRAGMTANVDFVVKKVPEDVLRIPELALSYSPKNLSPEDKSDIERKQANKKANVVWVWRDNHASPVYVKKGATDGTRTQVEAADGSKLDTNSAIIVEDAPAPQKRGLFETPIRLGPG